LSDSEKLTLLCQSYKYAVKHGRMCEDYEKLWVELKRRGSVQTRAKKRSLNSRAISFSGM